MTLDELRRTKRDEILRIAAIHGASNVRIFGSVARGDANEASDVDLLVDLETDEVYSIKGIC
jgi:predicted nucleotidyltransferase